MLESCFQLRQEDALRPQEGRGNYDVTRHHGERSNSVPSSMEIWKALCREVAFWAGSVTPCTRKCGLYCGSSLSCMYLGNLNSRMFQDVAKRKRFVGLVDSVREFGGDVKIFSSLHVSGEQLDQLTGLCAVLRYISNQEVTLT